MSLCVIYLTRDQLRDSEVALEVELVPSIHTLWHYLLNGSFMVWQTQKFYNSEIHR